MMQRIIGLTFVMLLGVGILTGCNSATSNKPAASSPAVEPPSIAGIVTTFAGTGTQGAVNGTATASSFYSPSGIATDGTNLYVADTYNNSIRKIVISTGEVTTLAGSGAKGSDNGTGTAATFYYPYGVATDGTNVYVADTWNNLIRKIVISTGEVTTVAGTGSSGQANGAGSAATFSWPYGVATDGTNLYVADFNFSLIRKIVIGTGDVTTFAGSGKYSSTDGIGTAASFYYPYGVATDGTNLYVSDNKGNVIRKIVISTRDVTTLAGSGNIGSSNGIGTKASFYGPTGLATDGTYLYVADGTNKLIRKVLIATGAVTSVAGNSANATTDGTGSAASFKYPQGLAYTNKTLYVADSNGNNVRAIK
jgi:sugar lactone lactonase YvrE